MYNELRSKKFHKRHSGPRVSPMNFPPAGLNANDSHWQPRVRRIRRRTWFAFGCCSATAECE